MLFSIEHRTEYSFARPVFFEPHHLRFCPRADGSQRVLRFDLEIEPKPVGVTHCMDADGNVVSMVWFDGVHDRMMLHTASEVQTVRENPYDFLLTPRNQRLPVDYRPSELVQLAAALRREAIPQHIDPARQLGEQLREATRGELVPFLTRLTETIASRFKVVHREHGDAWPSATTIEQQQGACRDLAVLWMDICRSVGLAARFVGGYHIGESDQDERQLHAWAEVYLPGAGWRGFDPTIGLAVADRHVAVAASPWPPHAAPVTATYRGTNVSANLCANIAISTETAVPIAAC